MPEIGKEAPVTPVRDKPRWRVLRIVAVVLLPIVALGVTWWVSRTPSTPDAAGEDHTAMARGADSAAPVMLSSDQARRIGVTFAAVTLEELSGQIRAAGQVVVDETRVRTISPKVDGWVERLHVNFTGLQVRRGDPLLAIYSPMLVSAQEELLLAKRLSGEVAEATTETRSGADDLLVSARRRLAYWDISADEIARIERTGRVQRTLTLRASAEGVVTEKAVTEGQRIMAGDALFRVADLSTVWIEAEVYEQDLRSLRVGQVVDAELDAYPGERWTGRIAYIYPTLTPETRTARVRAQVTNRGMRLKPGMYATVNITGTARAAMLTVPRGAVLATGERQLVFVRRADGQLEPRSVTLGASTAERIQVMRGLQLGDTVVASATFLVDAESNLGTALGGMGDMPGMEMTIPPTAAPKTSPKPPARPTRSPARANPSDTSAAHSGHRPR